MKTVYKDGLAELVLADSFEYLASLESESIDVIIADPPYFLSNDGFSNSGGKMVSVNKGNWDKSEDIEAFYKLFLVEALRVLKKDGTLWVFGTMHNIYTLGYLLPKVGFKILNNITWRKTNPAPNLSCRMFTHSTETIIWAKKKGGKQLFNYALMKEQNAGKQMKDVWSTANTSKGEKRFGKHPTQKPLAVLKRMVEASTNTGMIVLDPFVGSGTTAVACKLAGIKVIGVDNSLDYLKIASQRLSDYQNERVGKIQ